MRDICRWHVEEFAYLVAKLKATPEGDGNLLDNTALVFIHEHAESNNHKNSGHSAIIAVMPALLPAAFAVAGLFVSPLVERLTRFKPWVMTFGILANGFLVSDLGRLGLDLQVIALLHFFQGDAQMQVAQSTQHGFLGMRVMFDCQARVFLQQFIHRVGQFLLIAPGRGVDG